MPENHKAVLIYFNVPDQAAPLGFNPLERVPPERRALAASGLLEVFKKLWIDSWEPTLERILPNALFVLLDQPEATLADLLRLLSIKAFWKAVAPKVRNKPTYDLWVHEFQNYTPRVRAEAIASIQNQVGALLAIRCPLEFSRNQSVPST